jgi:mannose-6-phosphate isomerase
MTIERASIQVVPKPWGSVDLRPWNELASAGPPIGELWFQRSASDVSNPALLLKLLFTKEKLSIQVHPSDAFAHALGLSHGKSEAWYILSAEPGAKIAVGLKRTVTAPQLRDAISDGSITELIAWWEVKKDDFVFVPAGTIHAIGAGLVIAEIQQSSDTTFRMFDFGRQRELHVDNAVGAAIAGPAEHQPVSVISTGARTLLIADPHFVCERIILQPDSDWQLDARSETWLLVLEGDAQIRSLNVSVGEAVFLDADSGRIAIKSGGLSGLLVYGGPAQIPDLLRKIGRNHAAPPDHSTVVQH